MYTEMNHHVNVLVESGFPASLQNATLQKSLINSSIVLHLTSNESTAPSVSELFIRIVYELGQILFVCIKTLKADSELSGQTDESYTHALTTKDISMLLISS